MADKKIVICNGMHYEHFDVEVNGESIVHFHYDEHGSSGMDSAKRLVQRLGEKLGI